jgi:cytochrome oxidase Cu insertion factor (SCO1/SenC/PrrC family)
LQPPSKRVEWIVWGAIGLTIAAIVAAFIVMRVRQGSPREPLPVLFQVSDFTLTNQAGQPFSTADLRGKVWLAGIIFTRCGGPCPRMTQRLAELQAAIPASQPVRFVTLTTDPTYDTPAVLNLFARRFKADPARWSFLTGSKTQIVAAAVGSLKLTAVDKEVAKMETPNDLFIHSTILVAVDKQGRARAVIETEPSDELPPEETLRHMIRTNALPVIERLLRE